MNTSSSISVENKNEETSKQHPYFDWVSKNFPLLSSSNFAIEYAQNTVKLIETSKGQPILEELGSRADIYINSQSQVYLDLRTLAFEQFAQLCGACKENNSFGTEARIFLGYLVMSDGYPAYSEMQHDLADKGALALRDLMRTEEFREQIHSSVSGIIGYSQHARTPIRLIMLEAFSDYFIGQSNFRPSRRELSGILFDALNLELKRPQSEQSVEFQTRLIKLLQDHPHPATKVVLSVVATEHSNESLKNRAREWLNQLQNSLTNTWETTMPDQISSEEFRASSLAQMPEFHLDERDQVQTIFNACKGLKITKLSDPRLAQLHTLLQDKSCTIRLASAIALSNIYQIDPACEVADAAIAVLTDWAVNGKDGRSVLDALNAVKNFESMSNSCRQKVETEYIVANQKFVFRSAMNNPD